jgi:pyruvate,water dikinase
MLQTAGNTVRDLPPDQLELLEGGDDARIRSSLATTEAGRKLLITIDEFMKRYGFLSANGTDFSTASWIEDPTLIWRSVARHARREVAGVGAELRERRRETIAAVNEQLSPPRRLLFRRCLASTRAYLDLRERASFLFSEDTFQFRRVVLAIGEQLVARGDLEVRDDVFYLYKSELWRLVDGTLGAEEARSLVATRKEEMALDAAHEPEETICGDEDDLVIRAPVHVPEYLVGIGGSPGTVEGYARVVRDPLQAPADLGENDILVVPFTDVGWTPLMAGVGGIVAEAGGQLSHTAIVAREYGLPAVVGVRRATRELQSGDPITLDGRYGRVYRGHVLSREVGRV